MRSTRIIDNTWGRRAYREECYALLDLASEVLGRDVLQTYLRRAIEWREQCDARR